MKLPQAAVVYLLSALLCHLSQPAFAGERANIRVIATGGTIAGVAAGATSAGYAPAQLPVTDLLNAVPQIQQLAEVSGEQIFQLSSQDLTNHQLLELGQRVNRLLNADDVDGVVITHGTDTMEETAFFLNLVVRSSKPVVLTGAMRSSTSLSADGPMNLYNAVAVAASADARGKGVLVAINDKIHGARDVTKSNTTALEAFSGANFGALGTVYYGDVKFYRASTRRHTERSEFDIAPLKKLPKVDIIYGYQDNSALYLEAAQTAKVAGIVSAGVGNGNQHQQTLAGMIEARKQGIRIVRSARAGGGAVTLDAEVDDKKYGFIVADNLNPQKSRILLMLALTVTDSDDEIQRIFFQY